MEALNTLAAAADVHSRGRPFIYVTVNHDIYRILHEILQTYHSRCISRCQSNGTCRCACGSPLVPALLHDWVK